MEANQTEDRPKGRHDKKKKHLKAHGKREKVKTKGIEAAKRIDEKYLICDERNATHRCKFLKKCRILASEKTKTSKGELFALMLTLWIVRMMIPMNEKYAS